jgi:dTDP-glucose 4,6-dehydratase
MLVAGGAGFIGSHFVDHMLKTDAGLKVVCFDALTYAGSLANLSEAMKYGNRFRFAHGDITDRDAVFRIFEEEMPDVAVNFAAETHVDRSIANPDAFIKTNILGAQTLMDACLKFGAKRFHQVSTDEVYGEAALGESVSAFTEEASMRPGNPYSASKAGADLLVMACIRTFGLRATISRSSNVYGERQYPEKLIPLLVRQARERKPMTLYGDGAQLREWLHARDACKAIALIIEKGKEGEAYNIPGGNETRNIDLAKMICEVMGIGEELITFVEDRKGHDKRYLIDGERLKALGWMPQMPFSEGLKATVLHYLRLP